jgi:hypothetical protein
MNPGQMIAAAFPFLFLLLVLLVVFRHPGASTLTRRVGGFFAAPLIFMVLSPRLTLGAAATPDEMAAYLACVGGGLVLLALVFGRTRLE